MTQDIQLPIILQRSQILPLAGRLNVLGAMRALFVALADGKAIQPPQQRVEFANHAGNFINHLGVLSNQGVYGVKTSPCIKGSGNALITAWTMLMSMETGDPLLIAEAGVLTVLRTAATTALAVDTLALSNAKRLAVIGSGPIALAHIRYVKDLRQWERISMYSLELPEMDEEQRKVLLEIDPRIELCELQSKALANAEVVMLCTSAPQAILSTESLGGRALITSISANIFRAHELHPQDLHKMDVYCDYSKTTPYNAGEMVIAKERGFWSPESVKGDLADLVSGRAPLPEYNRHVFFRSIGLGLEDVAIALELYRLVRRT